MVVVVVVMLDGVKNDENEREVEISLAGKTSNTLVSIVTTPVIGSMYRLGIEQTRDADRGSEHEQVLCSLSPYSGHCMDCDSDQSGHLGGVLTDSHLSYDTCIFQGPLDNRGPYRNSVLLSIHSTRFIPIAFKTRMI